MNMSEYLDATAWAVGPLWRGVLDQEEQIGRSSREILFLDILKEKLLALPHSELNSQNPSDPSLSSDFWQRTEIFRKDWGEEPTPESINRWREYVANDLTARRKSVSVLCGSILMIAQNGIKLVVGPPSVWRHLENSVISRKNEAVLPAIWHSRNQAAPTEGLIPNHPSALYFSDLERRLGQDFSVSANADYIPELVVRRILGWIPTVEDRVEHQGILTPTYGRDMLAIGSLFGK